MNTKFKSGIKLASLSIILFSFVIGIYANNKYPNSLNTKIGKTKLTTKTSENSDTKLAGLEKEDVTEKYQNIEDWMLNININKVKHEDQMELQEWMFDEYFWKIEKPFWKETPTEEPREVESWMMNINTRNIGCIDVYSDFKEKEWMKVHNFFIL